MFEYLEKLRSKPIRAKKRIAFFASLFLAIIILSVWITVIYPDFKEKNDKIDNAISSSTSPFAHFKEVFLDTFSEARDKIKDTKDSMKSAMDNTNFSTTTNATSTAESTDTTNNPDANPVDYPVPTE